MIHDIERSLHVLKKYPLATVITYVHGQDPFVSHLPLVVEQIEDRFLLIGHLARANPHWKALNEARVLAIFHGPQTYITPQWYSGNDVPTWNYAVVHVKGHAKLLEEPSEIVKCLEKLTKQSEGDGGWDFWIPDDLAGPALAKAIVGVQISVESIQGKFKLSQNRSREDRLGIVRGLSTREDAGSREILALMNEDLTK